MKQASLVLGVFLSAACALAAAQGQSGYRAQVSKAQRSGAAAPGSAASGAPTRPSTTPPSGSKPRKASSFAPHPTRQRVFGAPIQSPIMRHVAPPKKRRPA
jgi:hypothetical protein